MISCVNPSNTSANHTLNTLRYSDRLKEKTKQHFGGNYNNINMNARGVQNNNSNNYNGSPKNINKNTSSSKPSQNYNKKIAERVQSKEKKQNKKNEIQRRATQPNKPANQNVIPKNEIND